MSETYNIEIPSNPTEVMHVEKFLEGINRTIGLDEMTFNKLLVATTEAVNNGIIHGNKRNPEKKVALSVEANSAVITVKVRDEGKGLDVDKLPDPLAEENLMKENGRGVFLMRSLMSSVNFTEVAGGWEVTMVLKLN